MNYQSKYVKYKLKYIKLQKFISDQNGGVILNRNRIQNMNQVQNQIQNINKKDYANGYDTKYSINKTVIELSSCFY